MEALETQITSVGSVTAIPVPEEMLASLGLEQGSRVMVSLHEGQLTIRPSATLHQQLERIRNLVAASPGPTPSELLYRLRQEERDREFRTGE